jgi:uncharacterized membrane protein YeaQ/YmgE (transglycosylase-associated protein family)
MSISLGQIIIWLIVGALAGSFAGMIVKRQKTGFGRLGNLVVGLVGALIGGLLFNLLNIDLGLGNISISFEDLLSAFVGSLIFLALMGIMKRRRKGKADN